jgi:hypothetical protein
MRKMHTLRTIRKIATFLVCLVWFSASAIAAEKEFTQAERAYWAFQPISNPVPPLGSTSENPIDAFISADLKTKKLQMNREADKRTLLKRATLDLTGLLPTADEMDQFLADKSPRAFDSVLDRLLASPRYGERWARHWLDLARYAESEGFKADETRPDIWRYRDYVIKSFNDDKPYDRFVKEQIAGDELWPNDPDALIATAFNRHYPDESNARNLPERRQQILNDITDTVGAVFIGMTYGCARCHDHKFDPILQADYYRLQAFFANTAADDHILLGTESERAAYERKKELWEEKTRDIREQMAKIEEPKRAEIIKDYVDKYPEEIKAALLKSPGQRSPFECQMVAKAELYLKPESHQYLAPVSGVVAKLKGDEKKKWETLNGELKKFAEFNPGPPSIATGVRDLSANAPPTFLLRRGNYDAPVQPVQPGYLSIIDPKPARIHKVANPNSTGRRASLAEILTDPGNPLPARVMVNRIWHNHFGKGIVGSPSDFGVKGERPTNPALLDWLASEFIRSGWSIKHMQKLIMGSATYRQSSADRESGNAIDPDNNLLWKFPRQRLEGEVIRDLALQTSGQLNTKIGGPSVFPQLPEGMETRGGWKVSEGAERDRRSIYVFVRRNTRYPMFEAFDMPDTHESCPRRNVTTSPLQALTLLNSKLMLELSEHFANRVMTDAGFNASAQIERAFQIAYCRAPDSFEKKLAANFIEKQSSIVNDRIAAGEKVALPCDSLQAAAPSEQAHAAAMVDFCHMLMNSNEFVYMN